MECLKHEIPLVALLEGENIHFYRAGEVAVFNLDGLWGILYSEYH